MTHSSSDGPAIELLGLTKAFGHAVAVNDLSLKIARGSTFGLLGPNGAGKSTTIKMLMGMLSITAGEARVLGVDVAQDPTAVKDLVGYVPETYHIYHWMRVGDAIGFCRALYTTWNDQTCREMVDLFRLDLNKKVKHLSKGTLVKLALLLAVSHDPQVLILDEPVAGLDPVGREEFLDGVLRTICQRGQTVLISSHTLDDVQRLADTVGILYEGRLLMHARLDEILSTTKRIHATLVDGRRPTSLPAGTIHDRVQGREWLLTVSDFRPEKLEHVRALEGVAHVEVADIGLEDLFKDIVKAQRVTT
jgi:ABC-2 type transport system ATP-binding protein